MSFDLLVRGGTVVDGSGNAAFHADVGIKDRKIVAVGKLDRGAKEVVDAEGKVIAPGFIDIHNHSDDTLLAEPHCESMVRQGVTTMVLGEGESQGPVPAGSRPWTTLGGYFPGVDTFLGLQVAAQEIADDLARRGFGQRLGPIRSTSQWLKWARNQQI